MSRLILLVERPYHLTPAEAEEWLRRQAEELAGAPGITRVDLSRLASVSLRFGRSWDWLFEVHLARETDPPQAAREPVCAALLADLRVLGMKPSVAAVESTLAINGAR